MTPEERIDANIRAILQEAGLQGYYIAEERCVATRESMRRIMSESYIKGSQDNFDALVESGRLKK